MPREAPKFWFRSKEHQLTIHICFIHEIRTVVLTSIWVRDCLNALEACMYVPGRPCLTSISPVIGRVDIRSHILSLEPSLKVTRFENTCHFGSILWRSCRTLNIYHDRACGCIGGRSRLASSDRWNMATAPCEEGLSGRYNFGTFLGDCDRHAGPLTFGHSESGRCITARDRDVSQSRCRRITQNNESSLMIDNRSD